MLDSHAVASMLQNWRNLGMVDFWGKEKTNVRDGVRCLLLPICLALSMVACGDMNTRKEMNGVEGVKVGVRGRRE
jgi:hypothetical protein